MRWGFIFIVGIACGGKTAGPAPSSSSGDDKAPEERRLEELAGNCLCATYLGEPAPLSPTTPKARSCRFQLSGACTLNEQLLNTIRCSDRRDCFDQTSLQEACTEYPNSFAMETPTRVVGCESLCERAAEVELVLLVGCPVD